MKLRTPLRPEDLALAEANATAARYFLAFPRDNFGDWLYAGDIGATRAEADAYMSRTGGRGPGALLCRVAVNAAPWPKQEPASAKRWRLAVGEWAVLVTTFNMGLHESTSRPYLPLQVVMSSAVEGEARAALAATPCRALLVRVEAVVDLDTGWDDGPLEKR